MFFLFTLVCCLIISVWCVTDLPGRHGEDRHEIEQLQREIEMLRRKLLATERSVDTCLEAKQKLVVAANPGFFQLDLRQASGEDVLDVQRSHSQFTDGRTSGLRTGVRLTDTFGQFSKKYDVAASPTTTTPAPGGGGGGGGGDNVPTQIHLALRSDPTTMTVSWVAKHDTNSSACRYGLSANTLTHSALGSASYYHMPVPAYQSPPLLTAVMTGLLPNTVYYYQCGDQSTDSWSAVHQFKHRSTQLPVRVASIGDSGHTQHSQNVLRQILRQHEHEPFDFLTISGDLSYANGDQPVWDQWGTFIEPIASQLPFMVSVGNHEAISAFIPYEARFTMPRNGDGNMYFSYDYSLIHVIALNAEGLDYFHFSKQYQFLKADLESVDRQRTPWVVVKFHNPWYCSNTRHLNSAWLMKKEFEDVVRLHGVDLVLQGHVHAYQRTKPVYKNKLDAEGPVYMTIGTGGNGEGLYPHWQQDPAPAWDQFHSSSFYGHAAWTVYNATHLHWRMYSESGVVQDDTWIIRKR